MQKHILIIGGGVIGLSTAYYAARRGHRVTLIERQPAARDGCSFGNAGMIVPSHFVPLAAPGVVGTAFKWMWNPESPLYIQPRLDGELLSWGWKFLRAANARHVARSAPLLRDLSFASRACFEELSALPGHEFGLVQKGLVMLCQTQHALDDESKYAAQANELGVPAQVLNPRQLAELDPGVTLSVAGGVYFPKDCHLSPARFMGALQRHLEAAGANLAWATEVTGWRVNGSRIEALRTDRGDFTPTNTSCAAVPGRRASRGISGSSYPCRRAKATASRSRDRANCPRSVPSSPRRASR